MCKNILYNRNRNRVCSEEIIKRNKKTSLTERIENEPRNFSPTPSFPDIALSRAYDTWAVHDPARQGRRQRSIHEGDVILGGESVDGDRGNGCEGDQRQCEGKGGEHHCELGGSIRCVKG